MTFYKNTPEEEGERERERKKRKEITAIG